MRTLFLYLFLASTAQASTFHVRLHDDLGSLDWNHGEVNSEVVYQLMEGLFRSDAKGLPQPALAKSFQWNQDKTRMKMDLRFSRWSDGKRVCAQDFVDSWNRLRSAGFASPYAHYAAFLASFEAKGCERLEVRFQRPSPEAPSVFAHFVFFPIRLDNLKQNPKAFSDGEGLLVNGPFLVKEWRKNTSLALERNPHYQGKKPRLERVEFLFIAEDSTAKAMFDRGELDWMKEVPLLLRTPALEQSADFRLFPSLIVYYFGLNARGAPELEDPGIRKLLSESLDRSEIQKVLGKECRGTSSWLVPEIFSKSRPRKEGELDPKARERLQAFMKKNGLKLAIHTYAKTAHKLLAEWAQGQWEKKLGIRVPVSVQESKVYWKEVSMKPLPIFFGGVTAPFGHPRAFLQDFLSGSSANWTSWRSPEYDKAVEQEDFSRAEEILEKDVFVIPLYQRDTVALVRHKWKGFHINPLGQVFLSSVR